MGNVRVRPLECGWLTSDSGSMFAGETGTTRMPVAAFLVEHPKGTVVFDTGMHPDLAGGTDRLGPIAPMFTPEQSDHWTLTGQLAAAGVAPDTVDVAVLSHLHFDHAGGLGQLPDARLLVQQAEWEAGANDLMIELGVYNPADFDLGHDRQLLDGEHDLFGDGAVRIVPTPGHTAGHQSLLVGGTTLLVGDACYCQRALDGDILPPYAADLDGQRTAFAWLRAQQAAGTTLVFSHDTDQWATLPDDLLSP